MGKDRRIGRAVRTITINGTNDKPEIQVVDVEGLITEGSVLSDNGSITFSILIFDKKLLTQNAIDQLAADMFGHDEEERNKLADWLLANQLINDKKIVSLMETWEKNPSPILRRLFWYYQARLRWTGQAPPENSADLLDSLEWDMADAEPDIQWAMNFCAGQIGIHQPKFRSRCIRLGKNLGLYKDEHVARNCTPSYLPEFIRIEVAKRE